MFEVSPRKIKGKNVFRARETLAVKYLLQRSIKKHGILTPLCCHLKHGQLYCYSGFRRLAAARRLGLKTVPVRLDSKLLEQLYLNPASVIWVAIEAYSIDSIAYALGWTNQEVKELLCQNKPTGRQAAKKAHRKKERRKAKRNPEVAPKYRRYDGYVT